MQRSVGKTSKVIISGYNREEGVNGEAGIHGEAGVNGEVGIHGGAAANREARVMRGGDSVRWRKRDKS